MLTYKGYTGRIEFDDDARMFHGEVLNTREVITFQGSSFEELTQAFQDSVDDYLEFCRARGEEPQKPSRAELARRLLGIGRRYSPERDAVAELVAERTAEED